MSTDGDVGEGQERSRPSVNWDDPDVPAGNAPPLPVWPLWVSAAGWCAWLVFLAVTAARG